MAEINSIRTFRELAHLTQQQLGEQIDVTRQTIAEWEKGTSSPSLVQLTRIAKVLGVGVETLLLDQNFPINFPTHSPIRIDLVKSLKQESPTIATLGA